MRVPGRITLLVLAVILAGSVGAAHAQAAAPARGEAAQMWRELLERRPFPFQIPLPEPRPADVDGTYTAVVPTVGERVHCLRCPDYAPEGGVWKIRFDKGVFRILHLDSGWKSMATAIITGDRLLLANDPVCIDTLGLYRWKLEDGRLKLNAIDDPCAIRLRAATLAGREWRSCRPPNVEAAVTEHWLKPDGCD